MTDAHRPTEDQSLLPCPCCGCAAVAGPVVHEIDRSPDFEVWIECEGCAVNVSRGFGRGMPRDEAIASVVAVWNARPSPEPCGEVLGDRLPMPLWQFEQRAQRLLTDEQAKVLPDNSLIGFICDAVLLARENESLSKAPLPTSGEPAGEHVRMASGPWLSIDTDKFANRPPCYICGYNGPGYYNSAIHPCAKHYHRIVDGRRSALTKEAEPPTNMTCPKCGTVTANIFNCPVCKNPDALYGDNNGPR